MLSTSKATNRQQNTSTNATKQQAKKATVDHSKDFEVDKGPRKAAERETDVHRITQRLKQVEYGKNTLGYARYCEQIPRDKRKKTDPQTPDPYRACSKRAFEGEVKKWRRLLHEWDPPGASDDEQDDDDDADHMHTPSGRKRTRGERSSKACSPDENVAPKRQTLSGGGANDDLYGGWEEDEVQL